MALLTVRENIYFSASLRLPSSMSSEEKAQKVDKLIEELGLSKVANSKVCFFVFLWCQDLNHHATAANLKGYRGICLVPNVLYVYFPGREWSGTRDIWGWEETNRDCNGINYFASCSILGRANDWFGCIDCLQCYAVIIWVCWSPVLLDQA